MILKVLGKTDERLGADINNVFDIATKNNYCYLVLDLSPFECSLGQEFNLIDTLDQHEIGKLRLKYVSQQFLKPFDGIPAGWRTFCVFEWTTAVDFDRFATIPSLNRFAYTTNRFFIYQGNFELLLKEHYPLQ